MFLLRKSNDVPKAQNLKHKHKKRGLALSIFFSVKTSAINSHHRPVERMTKIIVQKLSPFSGTDIVHQSISKVLVT